MDEIMVMVSVISAKDGSIIEKIFPLDEGHYKAIKTLSAEEQLSYS